ncbi:putative RNA recognition motif domain, nucleotide-binding alpha-beta plait domain superfamily [Helianthus annuus]|nr:putative RNA recognition motif domain, nucleotide-binding alpha-beta plait domain superfamily [Helianthus annuus]
MSRQEFMKEKKFNKREARLRNTTSFFISNLPDACDQASLWSAFEHLDNLEDAFVPIKKDRAGNKFGFIKLSNVSDPVWWIEKLKGVRIDGAVLGVNLARFNRDGSKSETWNKGSRVSVFDRLQGLNQTQKPGMAPVGQVSFRNRNPATMAPPRHRGVSFSSVVAGESSKCMADVIALPPINTETKKSLEFKSLVGEVKDIEFLNELSSLLSGITEEGLKLKYLGGLKVLLCFNNPMEAEEFRWNMVNEWEKWFSRLYIWEGLPPIFERVAWIKILGVPVCLWDRHVFNKIGERCSRLLVKSDAEATNGNLAEERVAVLVNSGRRISEEFELTWKEHKLKIWVEEISGQWSPAFLEEVVSIPGSPVRSSEVEGSPCTESGKCNDGVDSGSCRENLESFNSPVFEEDMFEHNDHGNSSQPHIFNTVDLNSMGQGEKINSEAEVVGSPLGAESDPINPRVSPGPDFDYDNIANSGPDSRLEENRPTLITKRPKRGNKNPILDRRNNIPDLNAEANSVDSDPFNLEAIFRQEREEEGVEADNPKRGVEIPNEEASTWR